MSIQPVACGPGLLLLHVRNRVLRTLWFALLRSFDSMSPPTARAITSAITSVGRRVLDSGPGC